MSLLRQPASIGTRRPGDWMPLEQEQKPEKHMRFHRYPPLSSIVLITKHALLRATCLHRSAGGLPRTSLALSVPWSVFHFMAHFCPGYTAPRIGNVWLETFSIHMSLKAKHLCIRTILLHKLIVMTFLSFFSVNQHQNMVGMPYRRKPVRNEDDSLTLDALLR